MEGTDEYTELQQSLKLWLQSKQSGAVTALHQSSQLADCRFLDPIILDIFVG